MQLSGQSLKLKKCLQQKMYEKNPSVLFVVSYHTPVHSFSMTPQPTTIVQVITFSEWCILYLLSCHSLLWPSKFISVSKTLFCHIYSGVPVLLWFWWHHQHRIECKLEMRLFAFACRILQILFVFCPISFPIIAILKPTKTHFHFPSFSMIRLSIQPLFLSGPILAFIETYQCSM